MTNSELSAPPSYFKYAIGDQHNLVLLFGAAAFSVAFASPVPLLTGAALELAWLALGSRLPSFRSWVDRRHNARHVAAVDEALEVGLGKLPAAYAVRFLTLGQGAEQAFNLARERADLPPDELRRIQQSLLKLRQTFLDYQFLSRRVTTLIDATPVAAIEQESVRLQQSYSAEKDLGVRMMIRKAQTQNQRQLQQIQQLTGVHRTIELRLEMMEKALTYLRGQASDPAFRQIGQELESLLTEVGSATAFEQAVNESFAAA